MKISKLFALTDNRRRFLAKYVKIMNMKTGYQKGFGFVAAKTQSTHRVDRQGFMAPVKKADRETYVSVITFKDNKLNVTVACSCGDHLYRHEVALWSKGAADIIYSNGDFPVITNPELQIRMCKHLCALYLAIKPKLPANASVEHVPMSSTGF